MVLLENFLLHAIEDIADLSIYGVGVANNGGGTDGQEMTLPALAMAHQTTVIVYGLFAMQMRILIILVLMFGQQ